MSGKTKKLLCLAALGAFVYFALKKSKGFAGLGAACDVGSEEDLAMAAMNLVALEEHLLQSYQQTQEPVYLERLDKIRDARRDLMKKLKCGGKGETWCASKHLLAACMRLMETGNKYQVRGDDAAARDCYEKANMAYEMFWENKHE